MRLAEWRKREGKTQEWLARHLGVTQPAVSAMERAGNPVVPNREVMVRLYLLTAGAVQPNDFFDLPALAEAQRSAA